MTIYDVAAKLPEIEVVRDRARTLAMLGVIIQPEAPYGRYHTFNSVWRPGEELALMANGGGDQYWAVFNKSGAILLGFDHESDMSPYSDEADYAPWPGVVDSVPDAFRPYLEDEEVAYFDDMTCVSACTWREYGDSQWRTGTIEFPESTVSPDGADWLFSWLLKDAEHYQDWAQSMYDRKDLTVEAVRPIFESRPLTQELVAAINPEVELSSLTDHIRTIGYPV